MNQKIGKSLLGIYDLFLAFGALYLGVMMIRSSTGIFVNYPEEWLSIVPFENWHIPGIVAIVVFGFGNVVAAIFSFRKGGSKTWFMSVLMGGILLASLICQVVVLGEAYLATIELFVLSFIQLGLCAYSFTAYYINLKRFNIF